MHDSRVNGMMMDDDVAMLDVTKLPYLVWTATCGWTTFLLFMLELQGTTVLKHMSLLIEFVA